MFKLTDLGMTDKAKRSYGWMTDKAKRSYGWMTEPDSVVHEFGLRVPLTREASVRMAKDDVVEHAERLIQVPYWRRRLPYLVHLVNRLKSEERAAAAEKRVEQIARRVVAEQQCSTAEQQCSTADPASRRRKRRS